MIIDKIKDKLSIEKCPKCGVKSHKIFWNTGTCYKCDDENDNTQVEYEPPNRHIGTIR